MRLRIVKQGKGSDGNWYYMVQRKYWFTWLVVGGEYWSAQCWTLQECEKYIDEQIELKKGNLVIREVTI